MRRLVPPFLMLLCLAGCQRGYILAEAIEPVLVRVAARHDNYVQNDEKLSTPQRETFLRSTELLRAMVAEARK